MTTLIALLLIPVCAVLAVVHWFDGRKYWAAWMFGLMLVNCVTATKGESFRHD